MRNSGKEAGMETDGQFLRDSTCTATFRNLYINFYILFYYPQQTLCCCIFL